MVDIGTSSVRAGYAGDDTPKAIIPTSYGYIPQNADGDVAMAEAPTEAGDDARTKNAKAKLYLGQHGPSIWRAGMEIGNPMRDGLSACFVSGHGCEVGSINNSTRLGSYIPPHLACARGRYALQPSGAPHPGH